MANLWLLSSLLRRGLFVLWGGWGERTEESAPPARFLFFGLFYFDGDTQREPLRRREVA